MESRLCPLQDEGRVERAKTMPFTSRFTVHRAVSVAALHCREVHGYDLVDGLNSFGFGPTTGGSSTVYRVLRDLEHRELVTSRWETQSSGPARRLYRLTPSGDEYLARWVDDLRETDRVLHEFLNRYDSHMQQHR